MSMSAMGWLQSSLGLDITGEWTRLVHLSVGGVTFSCQRKTFREYRDESVLCRMILDDAGPKAEDGSVVIDRDGNTFRHVLNFLRSGKLLLPEGFDEWDLLLDDAGAYGLKALEDAITNHTTYRQLRFRKSLPPAVFLRWSDTEVHLLPPLPFMSVHPETGKLMYQSREIGSLHEAVTVLLSSYEMGVEEWQKDLEQQTIFFTLRR